MINNSTEPEKQDKSASEKLVLSGLRKKHTSPLNAPVWRFTLLVTAGCLSVWFTRLFFGFTHPVPVWIVAFLASASWVIAVRMLLLDSKLKKFWIIWLAGGFCIIFLSSYSRGIWVASATFSFVFLLFRRYKPYKHLTSRRRTGLFLIGFVIFSLLTLGLLPGKMGVHIESQAEDLPQAENVSPVSLELPDPATLGRNLAGYSLGSLRLFWFFSLFHLFFSIRLHFMNLRPKLAVSTFLIAVVPLFLVLIMGIITIYSTLGENRAVRAQRILEDWANLVVLDESLFRTISSQFFSYEERGREILTDGANPSWLPEFLTALRAKDSPLIEWLTSDSAQYFWIDSELWLINLNGAGKPDIHVRACRVDKTMMDRLAQILQSDIRLSFSNPVNFTVSGDITIRTVKSDTQDSEEIRGKVLPGYPDQKAPADFTPSIWRRPLYFGMSHLDVVFVESNKFENQLILLMTEVSLYGIIQELLSEKNPLSQAVMIALLTLAILLFILEAFALFFGIRLTTGFVSAVRALHHGTRRIAEGDLDTQIDIPNEDELGDLAASFNEMAAAVKVGREEAIARERLESELKTARQIQEKLLPHEMPLIPGFEISGTSLPSQQVGGDYFDFLDMGTGKLGIAIADVSGKGIPAALLMANLQASLHAQAFQKGEVADTTSRMNNLLVRSTDSHMFITFFYGVLDRRNSKFTFTNAGHNPPILFLANGRIDRLEAGGLLLGFLLDQKYIQQTVAIKPGDVLVLFTDGVTEAVSSSSEAMAGNLFGEERLIEAVRASAAGSAREIQAAVLEAISSHTENSPQNDDITLVVIKRGKK